MKKLLTLLAISAISIGLASCDASSQTSSTPDSSTTTSTPSTDSSTSSSDSTVVKGKLTVSALPTKADYIQGEKFSSEGLEVLLVEDGKEGVSYTSYTLMLNGKELKDGDALTELGEQEVIVKASDAKNIKSTSFKINVSAEAVDVTLEEALNNILEKGNYTIDITIADGTKIRGLVSREYVYYTVTNGIIDSPYVDNYDAGSGIYNGYAIEHGEDGIDRTFAYNVIDGKIANASYAESEKVPNPNEGAQGFTPSGVDQGLFNKFTSASLNWGEPIYNASIFGDKENPASGNHISDANFEYIRGLKPVNNKYTISGIENIEWALWLAGDRDNAFSVYPAVTLPDIITDHPFKNGKVEITVNEDMTLNLVTAPNTEDAEYIKSYSSKIHSIGTTTFPELEAFLAQPDYQII